jgi:hypothetical protein
MKISKRKWRNTARAKGGDLAQKLRDKESRLRRQHNGTKIPKFTRKHRAEFLAKYPFCMICLRTENLVADHCHATLKLRAVLCSRCNTGLGAFLDDPAMLRAAATYLEYFRDPA